LNGAMNTYLYVEGLPTLFFDPTGHSVFGRAWGLLPEGFHRWFGGGGHIPVIDPGPAQDYTLLACNIASIAAPGGILIKGGKILHKARGFEVTISRNWRFGWHRFPYRGKVVNRPQYHRRITGPDGKTIPGGGIGRHRPWE
jgi:hypothetical protein